ALELTATNTYSGGTTVGGGVLRLSNSAALPGGNLTLVGGVVELAAGDFTRALGTSAGQVQFTDDGGFSASGANRVVNLGGTSAQVTWAANGFLPDGSTLLLGSASDDSMVDFQNPINLGAVTRTVQVTGGSASVDAQLSGLLSGSGGLIKSGNGTLALTNTDNYANGFTGGTTIAGGTLEYSDPSAVDGGNIEFAGGNLVLSLGGISGGGSVSSTDGASRRAALSPSAGGESPAAPAPAAYRPPVAGVPEPCTRGRRVVAQPARQGLVARLRRRRA
ncbi:MAG: autotransporter-associated beta strand repeat-containing protein, partial [Thermoguttaceae bacterium]